MVKSSPREHAAPKSGVLAVAFRRALRDLIRMVDHGIDASARIFHVAMKILGPVLICVAHGLIGFVVYTYFVHALPFIDGGGLVGQCSLTALGLFLVSNTLYNYWHAICLDAGLPPEYKEVAHLADESDLPKPRQCLRCSRVKPARAHHCSVCGRCILKMDHHCPWINNCVGFGNYRYFCLFMLFLVLSCCFIVVVFLSNFQDIIFPYRRRRGMREFRQSIMTSFMICCSILIALCILGGFHIWLVLTNQTTIEFQTNILRRKEARKNGEYFRNPYDLGRTRNFQQVFGPNPFCRLRWLMPYVAQRPSGDGIDFPSLRPRGL